MLVQLEHDGAINIPPGAPDFLVSDDFRLPMDVNVLAVYPHAHYLGHVLEGYATLPTGRTRKWLIRIPNWDPNWQGAYHPIKIRCSFRKGTVVSMRYHYDNPSLEIRAIRISRRAACCPAIRQPTKWGTCGCKSCRATGPAKKVTAAWNCRKLS